MPFMEYRILAIFPYRIPNKGKIFIDCRILRFYRISNNKYGCVKSQKLAFPFWGNCEILTSLKTSRLYVLRLDTIETESNVHCIEAELHVLLLIRY